MSVQLRHLRQALIITLLITVGGTLSIAGYAMWRLRAETLANAMAVATLHTRAFEDFLTQGLRVTELAAANTDLPDQPGTGTVQTGAVLAASLRHAPLMRSLSLLGEDGRIVASSNPANIGVRVDTSAFLPLHSDGPGVVRIGLPWAGRDFADGRPATSQSPVPADAPSHLIPVILTVTHTGHVDTLLVALNPEHAVRQFLLHVDPRESVVDVLRFDGSLLMSTDPAQPPGTRQDHFSREFLLGEMESGSARQIDERGRSMLVAFRASRLYPLVVVTHTDRASALTAWKRSAATLLAVLLPALMAIATLALAMHRRQVMLVVQRADAERRERVHATVFDASSDSIVITDQEMVVLSVNSAFTRITGFTENEVLGKTPRLWSSGKHDRSFYEQVWKSVTEHGEWDGELINRRKDGRLFDARVSITVSRDDQGKARHYIGTMSDITERKQAQAQLHRNEERFRSLTLLSSDWYWEQDADFRFVRLDGDLETITGISTSQHIGLTRWDMPALNLTEQDWDEHRAVLRAQQPFHDFEMRRPDHNGREHWVSISGTPVFDEQGVFTGYRGVGTDITRRKLAEDRLERAASVFTHSREAIMITSASGEIENVNAAFTRITGYALAEVVGRNPSLLASGRHDKAYFVAMWRGLLDKGHWYGEIWNRRKDGSVFAAMQTIGAVRDDQGRTREYVSLFSDITSIKEHEQQLEHIAHYDVLTGLPNRVLLSDRLQQAMALARRSGSRLGVAFLDLDGFKSINDRHGHTAGDQLLVNVAQRMKSVLRDVDTLARLGGDEFVAVLQDQGDARSSEHIVSRLLEAAARPVQLGPLLVNVSASLGVTFYPQEDDVDADQLLRQADQAMYQAKLAGRNRHHVFDADQDRHVRGHFESVERMRLALQAREFTLVYQPQVDLGSGRFVGVEALLRWQHPERGLLLPGSFLHLIEDLPLAVELGEWVITTALEQLVRWDEQGHKVSVSVNVGARQLQAGDFTSRLAGLLAHHPGAGPGRLELEVLETSALADVAKVSELIAACRNLGVSFAIDDFGTGYSSLTYLKRLPVQRIKIDQSFVSGMLDDSDDLAILQGVIGLAGALRREVIAEGVETVEQGQMLLRLGCQLAQGNGIAAPMPADQLPGWLARWRPAPQWKNLERVDSDALPLLLAVAEHRAWIGAVIDHLNGDRPEAPVMDLRQCRFGNWLGRAQARERLGSIEYLGVQALHGRIHQLAETLCALHAAGAASAARARMPELVELRDVLVQRLSSHMDRREVTPAFDDTVYPR